MNRIYHFSSTYEPEWATAVGAKGDVLYVEPGEPHSNRDARYSQTPAAATNDTDSPDDKTAKPKKGIKKKVKNLIGGTSKKHGAAMDVKQEERNNLRNGFRTNGYSPSVTFNDKPTGMIKEVHLFVDPSKHNYGRRASLCETLFGIMPGHFSTKPERNRTSRDNRIMVQALLPGNEAIKSGDVKIGVPNSFLLRF